MQTYVFDLFLDDIDHEVIRYVLTNQDDITEDMFTFDLVDSNPNRVSNNMFHIMWSVIEFASPVYNVTESAGVIRVPVIKKGNLKQVRFTSPVCTCDTVIEFVSPVYNVTESAGVIRVPVIKKGNLKQVRIISPVCTCDTVLFPIYNAVINF